MLDRKRSKPKTLLSQRLRRRLKAKNIRKSQKSEKNGPQGGVVYPKLPILSKLSPLAKVFQPCYSTLLWVSKRVARFRTNAVRGLRAWYRRSALRRAVRKVQHCYASTKKQLRKLAHEATHGFKKLKLFVSKTRERFKIRPVFGPSTDQTKGLDQLGCLTVPVLDAEGNQVQVKRLPHGTVLRRDLFDSRGHHTPCYVMTSLVSGRNGVSTLFVKGDGLTQAAAKRLLHDGKLPTGVQVTIGGSFRTKRQILRKKADAKIHDIQLNSRLSVRDAIFHALLPIASIAHREELEQMDEEAKDMAQKRMICAAYCCAVGHHPEFCSLPGVACVTERCLKLPVEHVRMQQVKTDAKRMKPVRPAPGQRVPKDLEPVSAPSRIDPKTGHIIEPKGPTQYRVPARFNRPEPRPLPQPSSSQPRATTSRSVQERPDQNVLLTGRKYQGVSVPDTVKPGHEAVWYELVYKKLPWYKKLL